MKNFDMEYSTQWIREMNWLKEHNISYTFVKYIDGVSTYKYKKTSKLFELLYIFYSEIEKGVIDNEEKN